MSVISNNNIAQAIYFGMKDKQSHELPSYFKKVVEFLAYRRLLSKTEDILLRLSKIIDKEEGRIVAKVSSSNKLDENIKKEIRDSLTKRYSAKEVILEEYVDQKFLGGFRIEVNNEVMDLTLKNKISKLKEYLIKNA